MLRVANLTGYGNVVAPLPADLSGFALDRWLRERFANQRAIVVLGPSHLATGDLDFDLRGDEVAVAIDHLELPTKDRFEAMEAARRLGLIEPIPVRSAVGGGDIFQFITFSFCNVEISK